MSKPAASVSAENLLREGLALHQQNRLAEAEARYRAVLATLPAQPDALHLLGMVAYQSGRLDEARRLIGQAIQGKPNEPGYHLNLGNVLKASGDLDGAEGSYLRALALRPEFVEAHLQLGNVAHARRAWTEAARYYEAALAYRPDYPEALANLATVYGALDQPERAIELFRRAVELRPDLPEAHNNLGAALRRQGKEEEARFHIEKALALRPDYAEALNNLGNLLAAQNRHGEALPLYHRALALKPDYPDAHYNLANALVEHCDLDEAIVHYRACLALQPGRQDAASNLLFALNYHPDLAAADIFAEYRRWGVTGGDAVAAADFANLRDPARRLKVGYVSADFNNHVCHYFLEPLLERHDPSRFEIHAYSDAAKTDQVTERLKRSVARWRDTLGMSDAALCDLIRADGIDILVDLAGRTRGNRLAVFARKPAPVQVTYLGYGYTTGLPAIDYFLTDAWLAPDGIESLLTEQPYRLGRTAFCYRPAQTTPEPVAPPAVRNGYVTFGSLSRTPRLNHRVIALWARILHAVSGSRLHLDQRPFVDAATRAVFSSRFAALGIAPERLTLTCSSPHWVAYQNIDIALDPFPHNGGTTTIEAFWMGVPVVSLADRPPLGRFGATFLHAFGLDEWLAGGEEEYLAIAVRAAADIPALAALRATMRERFAASPLRDEAGFTEAVEAAYRDMWSRWCASC